MNALRALALPKLLTVFWKIDLKKKKQLQKGKWRIKKTSKIVPFTNAAAVVTGDTSGIVASLHCLAMEGVTFFCLFTLHSYGEGGKTNSSSPPEEFF